MCYINTEYGTNIKETKLKRGFLQKVSTAYCILCCLFNKNQCNLHTIVCYYNSFIHLKYYGSFF